MVRFPSAPLVMYGCFFLDLILNYMMYGGHRRNTECVHSWTVRVRVYHTVVFIEEINDR